MDGQAPCCRAYHTAVLVGTQLFIFGGWKVRPQRSPAMCNAVPRPEACRSQVWVLDLFVIYHRAISSSTTCICWTALTACVQVRNPDS